MTGHQAFAVEPWGLRESGFALDVLGHAESVFALANGHVGLRGTLDEGEPAAAPGTYLNGFYEERPLPYAEAGYGYPESGQTVVNVPNGSVIRLLVDDEPLDLRYGEVIAHERFLDFRTGVLHRTTDWVSPTGRVIRVRSRRLVSFTQRAVTAIAYEVEPLDATTSVVVQSELQANLAPPEMPGDPRSTAALRAPLAPVSAVAQDRRVVLVHRARVSGLLVAAGIDHAITFPGTPRERLLVEDDLGRYSVAGQVAKGERLRLVKLVAHGWSAHRSAEALRAQVDAALTAALGTGFNGIAADQDEFLRQFWSRADIELEGDPEIQQAVRFALFHTLQAGARGEQRALPAKGLTGPGYDGHAFWDTETFVLPLLTYTLPEAARDALSWRHSTLGTARDRAQEVQLRGAAFPWRTIDGRECSAYWPAGTASFHINADIADATVRYLAATGDADFEERYGVELLAETARLWASLGHRDGQGRFRIDGVTGPDEYTAVADDNLYTNLMARHNLAQAAALARRRPDVATRLGIEEPEIVDWEDAAARMLIPYDERRGVHPQSAGFLEHERWDFEATAREEYPLLLHRPYVEIYRKQVVKQADVVLAMHLRGDAFTAQEKARNFAYYEEVTVRDSSLSACTQAIIAAEVGHLELAHAYLGEAALVDLHDLKGNTTDGMHIASLAGAWSAVVAGFGGMRDHSGRLTFAPRLPSALTRLAFRLVFRGSCLMVEVGIDEASYTNLHGDPLEIAHHGERLFVSSGAPVTRRIPAPPAVDPVHQPRGLAPSRRGSSAAHAARPATAP